MTESILRVFPEIERYVHARVSRRLKGCFEAADVLQEIAVVALQSAPKLHYRTDEATLAWLKLAARRVVVDLARKRCAREAFGVHPVLDEACADEEVLEPHELFESKEEREVLGEQLRELSLTDRSLLASRYFEGASYDELANQWSCTKAAIRVRVHRALARLRDRAAFSG